MRSGLIAAVTGCLFSLCAVAGGAPDDEARTDEFLLADLVLVEKSERKLYLLHDQEIIGNYDIDLGLSPVGDKRHEGDSRTPEGRYTLDYKLFDSAYFLAIHISYPNAADRRRARAHGRSPGGNIMIHGFPNGHDDPQRLLGTDWTEGCIAVSNQAMLEIWERVVEGTPIRIRP